MITVILHLGSKVFKNSYKFTSFCCFLQDLWSYGWCWWSRLLWREMLQGRFLAAQGSGVAGGPGDHLLGQKNIQKRIKSYSIYFFKGIFYAVYPKFDNRKDTLCKNYSMWIAFTILTIKLVSYIANQNLYPYFWLLQGAQ